MQADTQAGFIGDNLWQQCICFQTLGLGAAGGRSAAGLFGFSCSSSACSLSGLVTHYGNWTN